ncbi:MAG TPA: ABC transporter ATP-binding protein, partial [Anaerolineae bacterium]|nr:ABC transporter ATP-binding protein [Anaerolineae bacterium]
VRKGEIYGFLGLNGAGKTTTIRLLLGMLRSTSGSVYICGQKIKAGHQGPWDKVGFLVEVPHAYPELTVLENLEIVRRLRGISDLRSVDRIIDQLGLRAYAARKARNLSLGNAQRLGLAKALLHQPELLILDEPANGLDPAGIVEIRDLLLDLAQNQAVTIFISSHILAEISKLATRMGIIHQGKLLQEIDTAQLETLRQRRLTVNTRHNEAACKVLLERSYSVSTSHEAIVLTDRRAIEHPDEIASILVYAGHPPVSLKLEEEDLESYFLRVVNRDNK